MYIYVYIYIYCILYIYIYIHVQSGVDCAQRPSMLASMCLGSRGNMRRSFEVEGNPLKQKEIL